MNQNVEEIYCDKWLDKWFYRIVMGYFVWVDDLSYATIIQTFMLYLRIFWLFFFVSFPSSRGNKIYDHIENREDFSLKCILKSFFVKLRWRIKEKKEKNRRTLKMNKLCFFFACWIQSNFANLELLGLTVNYLEWWQKKILNWQIFLFTFYSKEIKFDLYHINLSIGFGFVKISIKFSENCWF